MTRFQRILVCVDHAGRDRRMLAYAGQSTCLADAKEFHFLHVADHVSGADPETHPGATSATEITAESLRALVAECFRGHGDRIVQCQVVRGSRLLEPLRIAHDQDVDLIVMSRHFGRKSETDREAGLARRITRKATCSVLVLPEDYQDKADEILVPVRDSDCSANALQTACEIASVTGARVTALNVFPVHAGYSRVGSSLEQHVSRLETAARRECDRLGDRIDTGNAKLTCRCAADLHGQPVPVILEAIPMESPTLVVIGARGRTGAAGVLLGHVTEQLIRESPAPLLAVKTKGECIGVLRALLTLAGQD